MKSAPGTALRAIGIQAGLAIAIFSPLLILGEPFTHSDKYNHLWVIQFSQQFLDGTWYPRWLDRSFYGMGAPTFYFYAPMFYWIAAAVEGMSLRLLPVHYVIPVTGAIVSAASGLAMYRLLREYTGPHQASLGGALYQLAPYHLTDFYLRGAAAEYTAFVFIPVLVLGMIRLAARRPYAGSLIATGYAGLIYSHLPVALLFSSVIPVLVVVLALASRQGWPARARFVAEGAAYVVLGLALAAAYVMPAVTLLPYLAAVEHWTNFHRPNSWFIQNLSSSPMPWFNLSTIGIACAAAVASIPLLLAESTHRTQIRFWAAVALASCPLVLGLIPWY